ncbi:MAG: tetratricopeptide repeat protein [Candidatus Dormibacterales bacterium]
MARSKRSGPRVAQAETPPVRRRLPGVTVRPGAVKQARHEAGLSLAQVGKGRVTAPAIYLIETGKTRPSLPTLEHIAHRTGKPLDFFLADPDGVADENQLSVVELEAMVAEARSHDALALGRRLLDLGSSAFRLGRIRYLMGVAHAQLTQPGEAASLLAEARAHFEAVNDRLMLAECIGAQAELASATHSAEAAALAKEALDVCRSLTPIPVLIEARLLGILGAALVGRQDWEGAEQCYRDAIDRAGSLFDLRRIATLYRELSETCRKAGQSEAAARYASRSAALMEVLSARLDLARSETVLGLILKTRGDTNAGQGHIEQAQELAQTPTVELGSSDVLLSLSDLALQRGNAAQAQKFARQAQDLATRLEDRPGLAEAHVALGRVADKLGDAATADTEFEKAIRALEQLGMRDRLQQCHGAYAEILERRGELQRAYSHMKRAVAASRPRALISAETEDEGEQVGSA